MLELRVASHCLDHIMAMSVPGDAVQIHVAWMSKTGLRLQVGRAQLLSAGCVGVTCEQSWVRTPTRLPALPVLTWHQCALVAL